jgi:hypothetical protein
VEQDDRPRPALVVQMRDGAPFVADGGVIPFEKALEAL